MHPGWRQRLWAPALLAALIGVWGLLLWLAARCPTDSAAAPSGCIDYWLNRYQTLIGIGGALLAALITARPVWAQLKEMQSVSAVQAYESLRGLQQRVEDDYRLVWELKRLIGRAVVVERNATEAANVAMLRSCMDAAEAAEIEYEKLMHEIERAGTSPWGDHHARQARGEIGVAVARLRAASIGFRQTLQPIFFRYSDQINPPRELVADRKRLSESSELSRAASEADATCDSYLSFINAERLRLRVLVNRAQDRIAS
jgi:hypothetical protein